MGLWARIKRLFSTNINAALDAVEDKEMVLDQITRDMKEEVRKTKGYIADAMVHLRKLEREAETNERMAQEYKNKAKMILSDDDESNDYLAKEALQRKKECEKIAAQYRASVEQQKQAVERLKKNLENMTRKVEEAKRKKSLLIAKKRTAEAQMKIQGALASKPDDEAFAAFDKIEEDIDDMETRALVEGELAAAEDSIDIQLEQITFNEDVESEYKALQAEVGGLIEDKSGDSKED
jgi:phage shock protein A